MSKTSKPKPASTASMSAWLTTAFVKQLYAGINDISKGWIDESPFPTHKFESYDNLNRDKEERTDATKIFTIGAEFKELMNVLLKEYISEISDVDAVKTDTAASLIEKLSEKSGVAATMARVVNSHRASWGETLTTDNSNADDGMREIIFQQISPDWQKFGLVFQGSLTEFYVDFTKSIAYLLASIKWFTGKTVGEKDVLCILYDHGISKTKVSEISGSIVVEKKPAKPRAKKATDGAAAPSSSASTPAAETVTAAEVGAAVNAAVSQ